MPRKELNEATRDCTIHMGKAIHRIQFKKRAPRAIREIRKFAEKEMRTKVILIYYQDALKSVHIHFLFELLPNMILIILA